jgi:hypothetical protein
VEPYLDEYKLNLDEYTLNLKSIAMIPNTTKTWIAAVIFFLLISVSAERLFSQSSSN